MNLGDLLALLHAQIQLESEERREVEGVLEE